MVMQPHNHLDTVMDPPYAFDTEHVLILPEPLDLTGVPSDAPPAAGDTHGRRPQQPQFQQPPPLSPGQLFNGVNNLGPTSADGPVGHTAMHCPQHGSACPGIHPSPQMPLRQNLDHMAFLQDKYGADALRLAGAVAMDGLCQGTTPGGFPRQQQHQQQQTPMVSPEFMFNAGMPPCHQNSSVGNGPHGFPQMPVDYQHKPRAFMQNQNGIAAPDATGSAVQEGLWQGMTQGSYMMDPTPAVGSDMMLCDPCAAITAWEQTNRDITALREAYNDLIHLHRLVRFRRQILKAQEAMEHHNRQIQLDAAFQRIQDLENCLQETEAKSRALLAVARKEAAKFNGLRTLLKQAILTDGACGSFLEEGNADNAEILEGLAAVGAIAAESPTPSTEATSAESNPASAAYMPICRLCYPDAKASVSLLPCGHLCVCAACHETRQILTCPVCGLQVSDKCPVGHRTA